MWFSVRLLFYCMKKQSNYVYSSSFMFIPNLGLLFYRFLNFIGQQCNWDRRATDMTIRKIFALLVPVKANLVELKIDFECRTKKFQEKRMNFWGLVGGAPWYMGQSQFFDILWAVYISTSILKKAKISGYRNFANRTLVSRRFATGENPGVYRRNSTALSPIGEIPKDALAKVRWTFASCDESILTKNTYESNSQSNWRNSRGSIGDSRNPQNFDYKGIVLSTHFDENLSIIECFLRLRDIYQNHHFGTSRSVEKSGLRDKAGISLKYNM
jgi:hypothetical protein